MKGGRNQEGAATVFVLAVAGAVLAAGGLGAAVGEAVLLRHRAGAAADAAALAAALPAAAGQGNACGRAAELTRRAGARLGSCTVRGAIAEVSVTVSADGWLAWLPPVRLNARAGPVETYREEPTPLDVPS